MTENQINLAETSSDAAVLLFRLGFTPIKVAGKNPAFGEGSGWQETKFNSEEEVRKHFKGWNGEQDVREPVVVDGKTVQKKVRRHRNVGVLCDGFCLFGANNKIALDAFRAVMPYYDETLARMGNNPFECAIFRRADPSEEFWTGQKILTVADSPVTLADIWGNHTQFVAWGVHPSGVRYRFVNINEILPLSTAALKDVLRKVMEHLGEGYRLKIQEKKEEKNEDPNPERYDIFKEVKLRVRIADVLGTTDTRIMCPLHTQTTQNPAAVVYKNPEGDTLYCHSCGGCADVIALNAKNKSLSMIDSARDLAQSHNIEVPQRHAQVMVSDDAPEITVELSTKNGFIVSELVYLPDRIILRRHTSNPRTHEEDLSEKVMLRCGLRVINQVRFAEPENTTPMWHIIFGEKETTGSIDDIVKTLNEHSVVLCKREDARMVLSGLIHAVDPPVRKIYPAVGLYWNMVDSIPIDATTTENFMAQNETQQQLFNAFTKGYSEPTPEERKEIYQASVDFIRSMPRLNRFAAYITRCYGCLAPLSYELKRSNLGVFPYLYLFGSKGSSKTHIGMTAATYCWGEAEALTGQSVESSFRLGMEFSATKFPRVIDEAHDVFRKNQEIFKAGATSILATKRGNKDKTMDSYPAFCSFILTSNLPPIYEEEDAQGGVADRVLVVNCARDDDFDNTKYQVAFAKLNSPASRIIGRDILTCLTSLLKEKGLSGISKEISDIASGITTSSPKITARRAYCLAELVYGNRIYTTLLKQNGIEPVFTEDTVLAEIIEKFGLTSDDRAYIQSFMQFAVGVSSMEEKFRAGMGIYFTVDEMIVTVQAITLANQKMGVKNPTVRSLADLEREFIRFGMRNVRAATQRIGNMTCRGIRIDLKEYEKVVESQEPRQSSL